MNITQSVKEFNAQFADFAHYDQIIGTIILICFLFIFPIKRLCFVIRYAFGAVSLTWYFSVFSFSQEFIFFAYSEIKESPAAERRATVGAGKLTIIAIMLFAVAKRGI